MKISLTTRGFDSKPNPSTIRTMSYKTVDVTPEELLLYLKKGYAFQNYYDFESPVYTFEGEGVKINHYLGSYSINIDFDHQDINMVDMLNKVEMKPTFCYESWSNKDGDYCYRFIYCFDGLIEGHQAYRNLFDYICDRNNIIPDKRAKSPYQYMNGTSSNSNSILTNIIYSIKDYISYINTKGAYPIIYRKKKEQSNIIGFAPFINKEFEEDFNNMSINHILTKYIGHYQVQDCSGYIEEDEDSPITMLDDWYEIKRYFCPVNGFTRKIKDGQGRRNKLYINCLVRRLINPCITFDELVYSLVYELCYFVDNTINPITKDNLLSIAKYALNADLSTFNYKGRKFKVNESYAIKHGLTKREIANKAISQMHKDKKEAKYALIGEYYDFSLTIQENIDAMNNEPTFIEAGYKINKDVIKRWKKENKIQREYNKIKNKVDMKKELEELMEKMIETINAHTNTLCVEDVKEQFKQDAWKLINRYSSKDSDEILTYLMRIDKVTREHNLKYSVYRVS